MINKKPTSWVNRRFALIFLPASSLMRGLSFSKKIAVLAIVTVAAFSVVTVRLYSQLDQRIKTAEQALTGISILSPVFKTIQFLQQHRGLSAAVVNGNLELKQAYLLTRRQTSDWFTVLQENLPSDITARPSWQEILQQWLLVKQQGMGWSVADNFNQHTFLIKQLMTLVQGIADEYTLTNHPELEIYYLLNTALGQLIVTQENLGQIRSFGTGILAEGRSTEKQRLKINALMAKTDTAITSLVFNLKRTGQYNASIKKVLGQSVNDILTNTQFIFNLVESDIFQFQYRTTAKDFFNVTTTAIDKTYETLYQVLIPTVTTLIQQHRLETINILYTSLATIMLCFLALLYLAIGIYIVSVKNIASIAQATEAFSQGDFSQRIQFDAKSELKYLAHSFNRMASELARLMATEKQEKLRIKAIMDSALDALIQINSKGEIIGWSHQAEQIFGWTAKETLGLNIHELIIPARYQEKYFLASEEGTIINQAVEIEALHRDGYEFPIELSIVPIKMNNCFEFNAFIRDISERKRTEENLQLFAQIFNEAYEGIMITDTQGFITEVNPAFCKITGYSREEVIGENPEFLNSGKQSPEFYVDMWQSIKQQGFWQGEVWNRKKGGELYAELLSISSIESKNNKTLHYVCLFSDITSIKQQQETLALMAHYDVLTKLPNRTLFADRFSQAIAHSKRNKTMLAMCFLDLDNFKPVNDNYGHHVGDYLLIEVAKRIKANIRDEDTVSRQGGDEFTLLLGDIESQYQCEIMLERILHVLAEPYLIDGYSISISVSIGVTLYPMDNADPDALMRHADKAMYQAKLAGKNNFCLFNPEEDQQVIEKHGRLKEIEQALLNNELCLYYQPKVIMSTGKVFGVEALIRWNHPEKGLIPPVDFLPILEGTELEIKIGGWVINEAFKQLKVWNELGVELELSINISSFHLQSASFIDELENIMTLYPRVKTKNIQLEILESSILSDLNAINNILKVCQQALGVNIALDDFGTGYSSLTHLRNLSVNTIKIDQTFVRDVLDDPNDYAIIDGVIGLADSFNRKIIAEGVETTEQGLMLLAMGCNNAQGYGISRPMPADDFIDWLANYSPNQEWINYGNKVCTVKENKIKLFRLALNQWLVNLDRGIQSAPESIKHWPIMMEKECFCGHWLKRARREPLFDAKWLKQLDEIHSVIHQGGIDLVKQYQTGELNKARDGLKRVRTHFEKMSSILGQCE